MDEPDTPLDIRVSILLTITVKQFQNRYKKTLISNLKKKKKNEILHLTSKFAKNVTPLDSLQIGSSVVNVVSKARSLGVIIDNHITLSAHVDNERRLANIALRKIGQIRKFLNRETAEQLVDAFVSSRLDSCNGVLYGLPESELRKLQQVQNSAARMDAPVKKRHHIPGKNSSWFLGMYMPMFMLKTQ